MCEPPRKRQRTFASIFDDPDLEREALEVFENGTNGFGYLSASIYMTWPATKKKLRAILETKSKDPELPPNRFEVEFTDACAEFFQKLHFSSKDEVLLALKGANITTKADSHIHNLIMKIQYREGVLIKFIKRRGDMEAVNEVLDTWEYVEPDWFSSPLALEEIRTGHRINPPPVLQQLESRSSTTTSRSSSIPRSTTSHTLLMGHTERQTKIQVQPAEIQTGCMSSVDVETLEDKPETHIPPIVAAQCPTEMNPPIQSLSKRQQRKRRKQLEAKRRNSDVSFTASINRDSTVNDAVHHQGLHPTSPSIQIETPPIIETASPAPPTTPLKTPLAPLSTTTPLQGPLALKAGIHARGGERYTPLGDLKTGTNVHLIGIVTFVTDVLVTRSGDWSCTLKFIDPSNSIVDNLSGLEGFKVICFTGKYSRWLPQPNLGDVVVMQNIKVNEWNGGLNGTGYKDKLRWAIYSPTKGKIHHGDLRDVPPYEALAGGYGHVFSPFLQPGEPEISYCLKLCDWWQEVQKVRKEATSEVHQVMAASNITFPTFSGERQHRLISEATPEIVPGGYMDCTIEVLRGYMNDNGVYSLYVTDYTAPSSTIQITAEWCSPKLVDFVFKVEAWDAAAGITREMLSGEYYLIKNLRIKVSKGGHLEGKLVEPKIRKLEERDAQHNQHLRSLIQRKQAWQNDNPDYSINSFEFRSLEEVKGAEHFNCAVEVLHVVQGEPGVACIYATDYTSHPKLQSLVINAPWAAHLEGRIVKIMLWEQQIGMTKFVNPGDYYMINKMRLKMSTTRGQFEGQLGGDESLIKKFNIHKHNEELDALIRRKEHWSEKRRVLSHSRSRTPPRLAVHAVRSINYTNIKDLQAVQKCPNKFRVKTKIIDFYPLNLVDCVIAHCTKCQADIPKTFKACIDCDDTSYDYREYLYQLLFLLEDEDGSRLEIFVDDGCSLFDGLDRIDIRDSSRAYDALRSRLRPLVGNLLMVHEDLKEGVTTSPDTPVLNLIINSWETEDKIRVYSLARVE